LRQAIEHQGQLLAIEQGGHWNWSGPQAFWQDYALEVPLVFQQAKSRLTLPMRLAEAGNHNQHATEITSEFSALSVQKLQALLEALPLESDEKLIVLPSLGLVKLFAHPPSQRMVGELIAKINQTAQRQILVEASVVEVELNQAHELGVDWSVVSEKLSLMSQGFTTRVPSGGVFQASYQQGGERVFDLGLRALESFGQIKVVSKPQLSVMNHQPALLRVVENLVYFTLDSQVTQNQTTTATQLTSQLHTQPVGFVLFLTPHIQPSGEVLLSLRPSLSMATQSVLDPHPELAKQGIESRVPVIAQREISTLMRLKPGEIGLLGGLIDESAGRDEAHLPGLSKVLGLEASKKKRRELVIFIRVRQSGVLDG
jgi:general secretion pathway protein D